MRTFINSGAQKLGINLSDEQLSDFENFYDEINKWGRKINITALIGNREKLLEELFLDSIGPIKFINEIAAKKKTGEICLLDIGSGGGFPGIPIKIAKPSIHVTLSDSIEKKVFFMRNVIRALSLEKISALNVKYEDNGAAGLDKSAFDFAISKAVAPIDTLGRWAGPHLKDGGRLICMKGPSEEMVLLSGYKNPESAYYTLPLSGIKRRLIIYEKT